MCSAVCQQSHSSVPARTDQSRSDTGSRPLITHDIAASMSLAVTVMMTRAYEHEPRSMSGSPLVTLIEVFWSGLSGPEAAQAQAVGHDQDRGHGHRGGGDDRVEEAEGGQRHGRHVVAERPGQIALDRLEGGAGQLCRGL